MQLAKTAIRSSRTVLKGGRSILKALSADVLNAAILAALKDVWLFDWLCQQVLGYSFPCVGKKGTFSYARLSDA